MSRQSFLKRYESSVIVTAWSDPSASFKDQHLLCSIVQLTWHMLRGNNDPVQMLEIGKESDKLKVMGNIIAEMAQGTDQSEYFPNVVKLVVSKSLEVSSEAFPPWAADGLKHAPGCEVESHLGQLTTLPALQLKKLVYMYLVRYAEEVPDIALLSISTFQKGLAVRCLCSNPQRACAVSRWCGGLRTLTSSSALVRYVCSPPFACLSLSLSCKLLSSRCVISVMRCRLPISLSHLISG